MNTRSRTIALGFLIVFALAGSRTLFAQLTADASVQGVVTDASGGAIANASVKLESPGTGAVRETTSNNAGEYRFELIPAGNYKATVIARGFETQILDNIVLAVSRTTTLNASLTVGQQTQTITVEGGSPVIDTQRTDISLAITPAQVQELPLNGRDFANLAVLAPGARPVDSYDPTKNRIAVFSVNGSNGRNVNVTVNGIDNKDNTVGGPNMQLPLEAVEEFNISTGRFSAANGRSEGAALNLITKSGTNDVHGALYFFDRNQVLNTNDYFTEQSGESKPDYGRQQFGGSIGAPLRKNSDFLFFAIEREREATQIPVTETAYNELSLVTSLGAQPAHQIPTPYFDWRYNGRYDHKINENNSLFVSYANQNNVGYNDQSGSTNDLTAGNFTTNQNIIANFTLNSVLSPRVVNSFTAGYQYWNNLIASNISAPNFTFPDAYFGTNGNVPQQSYQSKWQFRDDMSVTSGKHTFKFGGDFVYEPKLGGFFIYNETTTLSFFDDPSVILSNTALYPQGFATPGAVQAISQTSGDPYFLLSAKQLGLYVQDDWKVSHRLTLNIGVRYDRDFNLNGGSEQADNRTYQLLKAMGSYYSRKLPGDDTLDFSPRIGLAYDVTGSGKQVIRAGYGLYFGQTFENIPLFMLQQTNPTLFSETSYNSNGPGDTTASVLPNGQLLSTFRYGIDPLPPQPAAKTQLAAGDTSNIVDPDYRNPVSEQANIGYSFSPTPVSVIEVDYVHELGLHENKNVVINPRIDGVRSTDAFTSDVGGIGRITDAQSISRSRYDGLNLSYRRRLAKFFSVNATYTFSRALSYNGAAADYSSRPSDLFAVLGSQDFGPAPSDERHRLVVSGIVHLPWGVEWAPIMQWASARPYNAVEGISDVFGFGGGAGATHAILLKTDPTNYQGTAGYTAVQLQTCLAAGTCFMDTYDHLRGQPFFELDSRFSKTFTFRDRMHLQFLFQAFDLTNRANFGGNYQGNIRSGVFEQPLGYITPSGVVLPHSFSGEAGFRFSF